jgi:hypothetical protein
VNPLKRGQAAKAWGGEWPTYIKDVKTFLAICVALLMFATLGVLFAGLLGLARGEGDRTRSNQLMRWRVILQGAALLLFLLLMSLLRS